jgi:large subunit ribosomal protein L20
MPRARSVVPGKARKKKTLHASKGAFHGRRKLLRSAKENVLRGLQYAYRDRRQRKRMMRRLWILRINAAARQCGVSYNRLIEGLHKANIVIDRKILSDLAVHDRDGFARIVELAKQHISTVAAGSTGAPDGDA